MNDSGGATIQEGADSLFGYADVSKYISTDIISQVSFNHIKDILNCDEIVEVLTLED